MGIFRDLGKKVEEFKQNIEREKAAEVEVVCSSCGEQYFTAQDVCSECGSSDLITIGDNAE